MVAFSDEVRYRDFVDEVVRRGIAAAEKSYAQSPLKLQGSIQGFQECRGKDITQLAALKVLAARDTKARQGQDDYWTWRCRELEIDWVCNVVSCALVNAGQPPIVPPTARGMMLAAEILGVQDS